MCTRRLVRREVFPLEVGKCSEHFDPEYKCVGTGKVDSGPHWESDLLSKDVKDMRECPRGCLEEDLSRQWSLQCKCTRAGECLCSRESQEAGVAGRARS